MGRELPPLSLVGVILQSETKTAAFGSLSLFCFVCCKKKNVLLQLAPHQFSVQNLEELSCMHCIFDVLVHAKPDEGAYS